MALEDLATVSHQEHFDYTDPLYYFYGILADRPNLKEFSEATFSLSWASNWYPQLFAKFYKGYIYTESPTNNGRKATKIECKSAYAPKTMAFSAAGHFDIHKGEWYQLGLRWDKRNNILNIYINGIKASAFNSFEEANWEEIGKTLYLGNPCFAISELTFYNKCISSNEFQELFNTQRTYVNEEYQREILKMYSGVGLDQIDWKPDSEWQCKLDLKLNEENILDNFYVQGCTKAPIITEEGLCLTTNFNLEPKYELDGELIDPNQVYLWTKKSFEGDLYVEFEFKPLKHNGLSLLMFQASGMQREDFMEDYPLRKTGSMSMVFWENVRNYDWEYFREMDDTRNDVASHVLVKNPWLKPMQYQCQNKRLMLNTWNKLQFIQEDGHLRGIVNGEVVFDVYDEPNTNNGPVYNCGHLALRCMRKTQMLFRNLKVYNKETFYKVL